MARFRLSCDRCSPQRLINCLVRPVSTISLRFFETNRMVSPIRYRHAPAYLEGTGRDHGLTLTWIEDLWARRENGIEVPGLVAVFVKT